MKGERDFLKNLRSSLTQRQLLEASTFTIRIEREYEKTLRVAIIPPNARSESEVYGMRRKLDLSVFFSL